MSPRETYGKTLVELGRADPHIVVLDADLSKSTMTHHFGREFPQRFFNCGIAEQNMMGIAAGLAAAGKTVFASTFSVFATSRCFDQVRQSIAQPRLNVKIVATHSGITVGEDGASHHAVEDIALACALPGFTVLAPADPEEAAQAVAVAARTPGPFYIRLVRPPLPRVSPPDYHFVIGRSPVLREGRDLTLMACGMLVGEALKATQALAGEGVHCRVLNMSSLKPLDEAAIAAAAQETGAILTVEEHLEHGGLGSRVAAAVARLHPVPMAFIALKDTYAKSGKAGELLEHHKLTASHIQHLAQHLLKRKLAPTG
ncbi:MAG: transketolase family protein [Chloroflexi bacterium]|nr:transketolase family protein [Chloroflexota bacterium]